MKLVIKERFWAVEAPTRTTKTVKVPLVVGKVPGMERHGMHFTIDSVTDEGVQVTVHYQNEILKLNFNVGNLLTLKI